jgi:ACT domain-containing protein
MNGTGQNLTKKQLKAIPSILGARSITEGVKKAGISKTTFYDWLKNPEFKAEFVRQRQELVDLALHELKTSASEAVGVLRGLLKAEGENIRLRTAQAILDNVLKSIEIENLEKRVEDLERSLRR